MAEFYLGLDFGTSGARACVLDQAGAIVHESRTRYAEPAHPHHWRNALFDLLGAIPLEIRRDLAALAIDGTSGTLLVTDAQLEPLGPALLYNDPRAEQEAALVGNPQFGAASGLAKRIWLARHFPDAAFCFHQADWLTALLTGKPGITDYHNALKSGFDVEKLVWPDWVTALPGGHWQQAVVTPGETIGSLNPEIAQRFGLDPACIARAGTTDSIAAFIASGVSRPGEAVTSLGSTLVLKLLSDKRVDLPSNGVYSHRYGDLWLAGGASNTGGAVLRQFFSNDALTLLSAQMQPDCPTGLEYYPLPCPGERFPINDAALVPRMEPRPASDMLFLQGLFEGMARIEALGYAAMTAAGAPALIRVSSAGGGAGNVAWTRIRHLQLRVPVEQASAIEAATGAASLAKDGSRLLLNR